MALHPAKEMVEGLAFAAVFIGEDVSSGLLVHDGLVDMHGRARLALNGLGHERGVHIVFQCRLADRALEHENLIGQFHRVTMAQVYFKLASTFFMDQRVDLQPLTFREMIDIVDQFIELVDTGNGIALSATNGPARTANRRRQRIVRIRVLRTR